MPKLCGDLNNLFCLGFFQCFRLAELRLRENKKNKYSAKTPQRNVWGAAKKLQK
jgi:hypothetical protein